MTDATQRLIKAAVESVEMWDGSFNFSENRRRIDNLRTAIAAAQQEAAAPEPDTVRWPRIQAYAGGRDPGGAHAWLDVQLGENQVVTRYVKAAVPEVRAAEPVTDLRMCANGFSQHPGPCKKWCGDDRTCPSAPDNIRKLVSGGKLMPSVVPVTYPPTTPSVPAKEQ